MTSFGRRVAHRDREQALPSPAGSSSSRDRRTARVQPVDVRRERGPGAGRAGAAGVPRQPRPTSDSAVGRSGGTTASGCRSARGEERRRAVGRRDRLDVVAGQLPGALARGVVQREAVGPPASRRGEAEYGRVVTQPALREGGRQALDGARVGVPVPRERSRAGGVRGVPRWRSPPAGRAGKRCRSPRVRPIPRRRAPC